MEFLDVIYTQRAVRKFKKDPVPDELIYKILDAAIRAPNGGNLQNWVFIVVKDQGIRDKLGVIFKKASEKYSERSPVSVDPIDNQSKSWNLTDNINEVPVLLIPCIKHSGSRGNMVRGAHIYPAVQNMLLTARSLGLGTVITTIHRLFEEEIKDVLDIPDNVDTAALIPLGYPADGVRFGPTTRRPVAEVSFVDKWENQPFDTIQS
mgnify:CR=1 FL=1